MLIDTFCSGCDLPKPVNDLGLCDSCFEKLERDLIRARDWDYSMTAFAVPKDQLENLREQVIREYGAKYELIEDSHAPRNHKGRNARSHSRNTQRKREIASQAKRAYDTDTVLNVAHSFLQQQNEEWVNFSYLSQHLYEMFYDLKPKKLGAKDVKYKSLLKFIADYPELFTLK